MIGALNEGVADANSRMENSRFLVGRIGVVSVSAISLVFQTRGESDACTVAKSFSGAGRLRRRMSSAPAGDVSE